MVGSQTWHLSKDLHIFPILISLLQASRSNAKHFGQESALNFLCLGRGLISEGGWGRWGEITGHRYSQPSITIICKYCMAQITGDYKSVLYNEGFQSEWCISTINHCRDTPFWLETLDKLRDRFSCVYCLNPLSAPHQTYLSLKS